MSAPGASGQRWLEANRRYLMTAIQATLQAIEHHLAQKPPDGVDLEVSPRQFPAFDLPDSPPPALDLLVSTFKLTPFERGVLLMCAGLELDPRLAQRIQALSGPFNFALALAALPGAHWSALSPDRPLRYWRLIELSQPGSLTQSPLQIDERSLHFLIGIQHTDERLAGFIQVLDPDPLQSGETLPPSQSSVAQRMAGVWSQADPHRQLPILQLCGRDPASLRQVAGEACRQLGMPAYLLPASTLPADPREQDALLRLWERDAAFGSSVLLVEWYADPASTPVDASLWIEKLNAPVILLSRETRPIRLRQTITFRIETPTAAEQRMLWEQALATHPTLARLNSNGQLNRLIGQFNLNPTRIRAATEAVRIEPAGSTGTEPERLVDALWNACRIQAQPTLGPLAQRILPVAAWEDLILPESQKQLLQEIATQVRQRNRVYQDWGFAARSGRGLGISALFSGPSGTGKTMAAEVLANMLQLDLYLIDLSMVISKYIGETEKNLSQVFDAAEGSDVILLFDEADALFGKRSEVKDSHDRYANIEVSYLLQRIDAYRGLAILTTNLKRALDQAFLRRIRFLVQFPFPEAALRAEIWRGIFPPESPTEGIELGKLARLNVTGGNIRNIALHAAFLAAEAGEPIQMKHILRGARVEYVKLEKSLAPGEVKDWVIEDA